MRLDYLRQNIVSILLLVITGAIMAALILLWGKQFPVGQEKLLVSAELVTLLVICIGLAIADRRARIADKQAEIQAQSLAQTERKQVSERFVRASEMLANESVSVRTAAIYSLGRIATDSPEDWESVVETICSYVKQHASAPHPEEDPAPLEEKGLHASDISACLTAICFRESAEDPTTNERFRYPPNLDLSDLRRASLMKANLEGASLQGVRLDNANLWKADLSQSKMNKAFLTKADLREADLSGAECFGADLKGAWLAGANLRGADLRHTKGLVETQLRKTEGNSETTLPPGLARPSDWESS